VEKAYDWTNFPKTKLYFKIVSEWEKILEDKNLKEQDYHSFLQANPAIFLTFSESYLTVSKLKLGSDYETDFVNIEEGYSDGTIYELIEIESPHTTLFDQKGKPTAKFNAALQQIRDWKRFLINNKSEFKKIFPTVSTKVIKDSRVRYKIVIGRRTNSQEDLEKRRQISEQENIQIVSFDRLTDMAKNRMAFPNKALIFSAEMESIPFELKNNLANPFFECISDSMWRSICKKGHAHIYSRMIEDILQVRTYNKYFDEYKMAPKEIVNND
jgi:hypothetical protein